MNEISRCPLCGRLDPYHAFPCYCSKTTMETQEKNLRLFYEHHTDGHPFGIPNCPVCISDKAL